MGSGIVDPYSPEALSRLTVTNLRIQLLKSQQCPVSKGQRSVPPFLPTIPSRMLTSPTPSSDPLDSTPFAVYSLLAKGTCLCHGHAEHCLLENEGQDSLQPSNVVSVSVLLVNFGTKNIAATFHGGVDVSMLWALNGFVDWFHVCPT